MSETTALGLTARTGGVMVAFTVVFTAVMAFTYDATREQSAASTSIAQRVETIAQMVEETSTTIRGTAETANQLELIAQGLKAQIGRFRV